MDQVHNPVTLGKLARRILNLRGLSDKSEIEAFLYPEHYQSTDPLELPGMRETVDMLLDAVQRGEEICVYGDYDADGITSTTLLVSMLRSIGAKVRYHVPDRFSEGYGMNEGVIRRLAREGIKLVLTCDCGISNHSEVKVAKDLGLTVLITDHHHLPPELPEAHSIVNPQLLPDGHKARYLPGVGVAYMLTKACFSNLGKAGAEAYLDVVALGIVADVVPLLQENRYLLQRGLEQIKAANRPGLRALIEVCNLHSHEITEEDIGFQLVPRLNAAGRISTAALGVQLLLCEDMEEALNLARELDEINRKRRILGEEMYQEALAMVGQQSPGPLALYQPHWHHGVIGIIAGRLAELHKVPVILMSLKEDGITITGSARSVPGVHIYQVLQQCAGFLTKFGGHAGAAGFSLHREQLELFSKAVIREMVQALATASRETGRSFDLEIGLEELNLDIYQELLPLGPFGEANPTPLFYSQNLQLLSQTPTSDGKHLRLVLGHEKASIPAMWWWGGDKQVAGNLAAIYSLKLNKWKGRETLQLIITDLFEDKPVSYVAESQEPLLEIIDLRQRQDLGVTIPGFKKPQFFAENFRGPLNEAVRDRYSIETCECLVLFSMPPGQRALQEMLALSGANKLVLAYGVREPEDDKEFLQQLLGMIKFAVANGQGKLEVRVLATATAQMEISVSAGLDYLQAKGLIKYEYDGPENLYLSRGDGRAKPGIQDRELRLRSLLAETRAFRRYLLKATTDNILQLISGSSYQQVREPIH